jgi:hypothetical protein
MNINEEVHDSTFYFPVVELIWIAYAKSWTYWLLYSFIPIYEFDANFETKDKQSFGIFGELWSYDTIGISIQT